MYQNTDVPFGRRLFILVGSAVGFTILLSIIASIVFSLCGFAQKSMDEISFLKVFQLIMTTLSFLVPALLLAHQSVPKGFLYLQVNHVVSSRLIMVVIVLVLSIQPLLNASTEWLANWSLPSSLSGLEQALKSIEKNNVILIKQFLDVHSFGGVVFNVLLVAIVPAIAEEFFFRGGLLQLLAEKMNLHVAIWVTAMIFSIVHFDVTGFIPRLFIGALLGYLFVWSGSLWTAICAHFINNLLAVLMEFLIYNQFIDKSAEHFGTGSSLWISFVGLLLFCLLFWALYRMRTRSAIIWSSLSENPDR